MGTPYQVLLTYCKVNLTYESHGCQVLLTFFPDLQTLLLSTMRRLKPQPKADVVVIIHPILRVTV